MNTCKTCRWWGAKKERDGDLYNTIDSKPCACPKIVFGHTDEKRPRDEDKYPIDQVTLDAETNEPISADGAAVLDGSGYWGELRTGPDFGCVQHESKP